MNLKQIINLKQIFFLFFKKILNKTINTDYTSSASSIIEKLQTIHYIDKKKLKLKLSYNADILVFIEIFKNFMESETDKTKHIYDGYCIWRAPEKINQGNTTMIQGKY